MKPPFSYSAFFQTDELYLLEEIHSKLIYKGKENPFYIHLP